MVTQIYKIPSNFGAPPLKFGGPKTSKYRRNFAQLRNLITNISRTQQDIVNRKTALQTMDTSTQTYLIRCTLVHERRKIGPESGPTQWAAIIYKTQEQFSVQGAPEFHCMTVLNFMFNVQ